jgi:hypothetical protein
VAPRQGCPVRAGLTVFEPESGKVLREARLKDGIGEYYA